MWTEAEAGVDLAAVWDGTVALSTFENINALTMFHHAESGDVVCGFDRPRDRWGTDPDRLVPHLTRAGLLLPDGTQHDHGIDERQRLLHRMTHTEFGTTLPCADVELGELLAAMY
ncbi:DUF6461 domain-containing protein [Embleya hyalina]|uniref:DUF6461 domain-containing protein n=1 Tax=Embleya hyalina TaxID=516124 RepID=UPI001FECE78A|nr:DUF6461 domain-containing protein [Embleya hyalina]